MLLNCLVLCPLFDLKDSRMSCSVLFSKLYSSILAVVIISLLKRNAGSLLTLQRCWIVSFFQSYFGYTDCAMLCYQANVNVYVE